MVDIESIVVQILLGFAFVIVTKIESQNMGQNQSYSYEKKCLCDIYGREKCNYCQNDESLKMARDIKKPVFDRSIITQPGNNGTDKITFGVADGALGPVTTPPIIVPAPNILPNTYVGNPIDDPKIVPKTKYAGDYPYTIEDLRKGMKMDPSTVSLREQFQLLNEVRSSMKEKAAKPTYNQVMRKKYYTDRVYPGAAY